MYDIKFEEEEGVPKGLIERTETVDVKAQISKVLPMLERHPALIVNKNGQYYGVVDSRSIYRARGPLRFQRGQTVEKYVSKAPRLERSTQIDEVILSFYKAKVKALPFMEKGSIIGVLDRSTLLKVMLSLKMLDDIKVSEAMSSPIVAVNDGVAMSQAKAIMESNRISRLLVLHDGKFTGLLTYFTLIKNFSVENEALPEMKSSRHSSADAEISGIIETNPRTIDHERDLAYAARNMIENEISSLIITDGRDSPIGMLTMSDIFEAAVARRRIEESRIFVSGLDDDTIEYEQDIRNGLRELVSKLEGKELKIDYVTLHVKRIKGNRYDVSARAAIRSGNIISAHIEDFLLERTFREAISLLKRDLVKDKEKAIAARKAKDRWRVIE